MSHPRTSWLVFLPVMTGLASLSGCGAREDLPTYALPPDATAIPDTPMALVEVARLDPRVGTLRAIAIDRADRVYACGSGGVRVLAPDGKELASWPLSEDGGAIAAGDDGTVYVGLAARVLKFDGLGTPLGSWSLPPLRPEHPPRVTAIAVRGGDVFVADAGALCVHRYAFTGDLVGDIGQGDPAKDFLGLIAPSPYIDVAVDPDNADRILVGNPGRLRVETYSVDGKLLGHWGEPGLAPDRFAGCCNPTNLALTREGHVVTSEKGLPRVKVSDRAGKLLAYLPPTSFPETAAGIDLGVDSRNRIYVAEPVSGQIRIYELKRAKGASP